MTNSNATATASSRGFGVFGAAFLILLVFKLAGLAGVSWGLAELSWLWVVAPLLIGFAWALFWIVVLLVIAWFASK